MTTTQTPKVRLFGDAYSTRKDTGIEGCSVCGRPITGDLYVNADNGPEWYGSDMGWYPIGPECAKKAERAGWQVGTLGDVEA